MAAAYEFVAATYGWDARHVERHLTDELLVLYLDAGIDRLRAQADARFTEQVESVRAGTIFAHDNKQHSRWRTNVERRPGQRPTGKNLAQLAKDFGAAGGVDVVRGEFEFRN